MSTKPGRVGGGPDDDPQAGMSLVEMLVVLVVLALAAAISGPVLRVLLPGQRLDAAADAVSSELALLRAQAVRTGQPASLVYDPEAGCFRSSRRVGRPIILANTTASVEVPAESRAGPGEIRFLPSGATTGGRITLVGSSGTRTLVVSRVTGAVRRGEAVR